ncbi:MAG: hypothetical protein WCD79_00935 [Chthoniobacteraceae bacterium]
MKVAVEYPAAFTPELMAVALISLIPLAGLTYGLVCLVSKKRRKYAVDRPFLHLTWFTVWILLMFGEFLLVKTVEGAFREVGARNGLTCIITGVKAYNVEYGVMPSGGNARIIKALRGDNPRKLVFFDLPDKDINANGEYTDPWGTPYRIDTSDPKHPWAYSFGPNKRDDGGAEGSDDTASW